MISLKKAKIIIGVILLVTIFIVLHYISRIYFYERDEIEFCKQFIINNEKVIETVGKINGIEKSWKSTYVESSGKKVFGRYSFIVSGIKGEKKFFVYWETNEGKFSVNAVSLVEGITDVEVWKFEIVSES